LFLQLLFVILDLGSAVVGEEIPGEGGVVIHEPLELVPLLVLLDIPLVRLHYGLHLIIELFNFAQLFKLLFDNE
jgi:hypothetical protein